MLITNLVYDGERIEIKAEAASFDTAEEIRRPSPVPAVSKTSASAR